SEKRDETRTHEPFDGTSEYPDDHTEDRLDHQVGNNHDGAADDSEHEVVDEHLEARPDLAGVEPIHLLEDPGGERAHHHGAEQHGDVGPDDDAHRGERTDRAASVAVDHPAARVCDE